ncbi:MAG TPA: PDZ domain-containing protein [Gemmatimonadaceae bacterium]|nr:PDZ domain-containing protein [Gemmatimonadaceae bacterium]
MSALVRTKVVPLLLACAGTVAVGSQRLLAQMPFVSAPLTDIRYEVNFTRVNSASRNVGSSMAFTVGGDLPVYLSLPAWTPGAYEISNFARNVVRFSAEEGGSLLAWDKVDPDTWRVLPRGAGQVTVRFDYLSDSLDNAATWARDNFLLFNGTNLFLYPEGRPFDFPAAVTVNTEAGWKIVTGMTATGPRTFAASNYHDLVDMPFFIGEMDVDSTLISGTWVRFATYPARSVGSGTRIATWEALKRIIPAEVKVFGEVPWTTYSILQIVDPSYSGGSGLEHQNSHVDVLGPGMVGTPVMPSLYAHEIFHAWNVKRLRPSDIWPYRYDQPQPTTMLWVSEGITDYYADLAEVRGGVIDAKEFYVMTGDKIAEVDQLPPTSLEDASLSTWIHPRDGTGYIYYPKGSLAGLLLDIMIRDATDNRSSLDVVMRTLYDAAYKTGRGFTSQEWWSAVSRAANNRSFDDFYTRYVNGREPFPYERILPLGGMRLARDTVREPRVGLGTVEDSTGVHITEVGEGSPAALAGAQPGDVLLSVGGISVSDPNWTAVFRGRYLRMREGSELPIRVRRGPTELTLNARLRFAERYSSRLVEDPRASRKARRVREGLLRGTLQQ